MDKLISILKPILEKKIDEAISEADTQAHFESFMPTFPWLGDNCNEIFADAVITVLRGMQDSQNFMKADGMLK